MESKVIDAKEAIACIEEGMTVLVGGFGIPGTPVHLVYSLLESGVGSLTLVKNDANEKDLGIGKLIAADRVKKLISSHIGLNSEAVAMMNSGDIEVDLYPQGLLAEKLRTAGAGLMAFISDIAIDTILADTREKITIDGKEGMIWRALHGDVALIHADIADKYGNCRFRGSAYNFNPVMAMAGRKVIVEAHTIVEPGGIKPDDVHLQSAFVDHVVKIPDDAPDYGVLKHHAR